MLLLFNPVFFLKQVKITNILAKKFHNILCAVTSNCFLTGDTDNTV